MGGPAAGMAPSPAILGPIWAVLLAGVTSASPYRSERGRCRPESEYFVGSLGICCAKCPPGSFAQRLCTAAGDTVCVPCAEGEYTELWNYVRKCHVCPTCDPRRDMVVAVNCSGSVRTHCECQPGYHCAGGLDCTDCEAHSLCGPGRQMTQPGTSLRDTQCGKCPPGTFKPASSLEPCQNHTKCRARGLLEIAPGTDVSDAECGPTPTTTLLNVAPVAPTKSEQLEMDGRSILIPVLIVSTLSLCSFIILLLLGFRRRFVTGRAEKIQSPADADQTSMESDRPLLDGADALHEPRRRVDGGLQQQASGQRESQQTQRQTAAETEPGGDGTSAGRPAQAGSSPPLQGQARGLLGLQACHVNTLNSNLTVHGPLYIYNGDPAPPPASPAGSDCAPRRETGASAPLGGVPVSASPEQETGEDPVQDYRTARPGHPFVGVIEPQQEVGEGQSRPLADHGGSLPHPLNTLPQTHPPVTDYLPHPQNPLS